MTLEIEQYIKATVVMPGDTDWDDGQDVWRNKATLHMPYGFDWDDGYNVRRNKATVDMPGESD